MKKRSAIGLFVPLALLVPGAPAHADASTTAPNQDVDIVFVGNRPGVVLARGVIDAVGRAEEATTFNGDGSFQGTLTFRFPRGDVVAPFSGYITSLEFNDRTCRGTFTTTGAFRVSDATGAYVGLTGGGTYTERGSFQNARSGGRCTDEQIFRLLATDAEGQLHLA